MRRIIPILMLLCACTAAYSITPGELGDSLRVLFGFPNCVPALRVKSIRCENTTLTISCNAVAAGKGLTREDLLDVRQHVSRWVGPGPSGRPYSPDHIRILSDGHELGELTVVRRELRRVSPDEQPLRGKTVVLWASHGRYWNAREERWVWQRARLWGTVEDRLTTEYTVRLTRLLEASGARVLSPRLTPGDPMGQAVGESGLPRWMEAACYTLRADTTLPSSLSLAKGVGEDYRNDLISRPAWVNWLTDSAHTPVDLVLALHTDGYDEPGDSTSVGTLAIYYDRNDEGRTTLRDGRDRARTNRRAAYAIHHRLIEAMRREVNPGWGERRVLCANYAEARIPNVPTVLIEIGSHKDLDDARYLLDPRAMDVAALGLYEGVCEALGSDSYAVFPAPAHDRVQSVDSLGIRVVNAFTYTCGPEFFLDSLTAGIVPGRYGIADSVSYALIGAQHNYDRTSPWVSDDDCGWGMCDTRWQRFLTVGNTHDYHLRHLAVLRADSLASRAVEDSERGPVDLILGREPDIPLPIRDSLRVWQSALRPILMSGAYIGTGPMVREHTLVSALYPSSEYHLMTAPNPVTLYCNESRALRTQPGDIVLYRWADSGLPAVLKRGNTVLVGTMLESLEGWQYLYLELINCLTQ